MKKTWTMAILAAGMMASCSSNGEEAPSINEQEEAPVKMELSVGSLASVSVAEGRGTGSVGGTSEANRWKGQQFNLIAFGVNNQATVGGAAEKKVEIPNEIVTAPNQTDAPDSKAVTLPIHYYTGTFTYDFYAYHFDDATTTLSIPTIDTNTDFSEGLSANVEINGTQDLMVATTNKINDITNRVLNSEKPVEEGDKSKLYSAWSARRGVTPTLQFNHLLSRLVFKAKMGSAERVGDVKIESITIVGAKSRAKVVIIPAEGEVIGTLTTNNDDLGLTDFVLQQRNSEGNMEDFVSQTITGEYETLGESMMLIPDTQYQISVQLSQTDLEAVDPIVMDIQPKNDEEIVAYEAGKTYDVNITVYNMREIEVNATLTAWETGGTVTVDPDEM